LSHGTVFLVGGYGILCWPVRYWSALGVEPFLSVGTVFLGDIRLTRKAQYLWNHSISAVVSGTRIGHSIRPMVDVRLAGGYGIYQMALLLKECGVHCSNGGESVPRTALFMARARPRTPTTSSPAIFSEVRCSKSVVDRSCKRPARGRVASLDAQTRRHSTTFRYATMWQAIANRNRSIAREFSIYELRA